MTENRRDFLKKSSIAIAGASAITSAATSVTKAAWVSSDETIKIGLIGCGGRGRGGYGGGRGRGGNDRGGNSGGGNHGNRW